MLAQSIATEKGEFQTEIPTDWQFFIDWLTVSEQDSGPAGEDSIEIICKCYKESSLYKLIVCHLIGKVIKQCPRRSQVQPTGGDF